MDCFYSTSFIFNEIKFLQKNFKKSKIYNINLLLSDDTRTRTEFDEHIPSIWSLKMTKGGSSRVTIFIWNFKGLPNGGLWLFPGHTMSSIWICLFFHEPTCFQSKFLFKFQILNSALFITLFSLNCIVFSWKFVFLDDGWTKNLFYYIF